VLALQGIPARLERQQFPRRGMQRHGNPGTRGVQQADGLVGQLTGRDVPMGQVNRGTHRFVEQCHPMVLGDCGCQASQHVHGRRRLRLRHLQHLEPPCESGVLFDVLLVFRPRGGTDHAKGTPRQRWFEKIGGVACAGLTACPDQGMDFIHEQDHRHRGIRSLPEHGFQTRLELAPHTGTGKQGPHIQTQDAHPTQARRHLSAHNSEGQAFDHRRLAHPGLAREQGVVLAAAQQDVHHGADFLLAPDHWVDPPFSRERGQVRTIPGEHGLALGLRMQRVAGLPRQRRLPIGGFVRHRSVFTRAANGQRKFLRHLGHGNTLEGGRNAQQHASQFRGLKHAPQQPGATNTLITHHQTGKYPSSLNGQLDHMAKIIDSSRTRGQMAQGHGEIPFNLRAIQRVVRDQAMKVAIGYLPELMQPMHHFHVRIASQLG
jgi:hypothetical protein